MKFCNGLPNGRQVAAARALRGITQAELARAARTSPTTIATFETGNRDMRCSTLAKVLEVLEFRVEIHDAAPVKAQGTPVKVQVTHYERQLQPVFVRVK